MPDPSDTRLQRRALDPAFELATRQVAEGVAPFVILGVADSRGVLRLEAFDGVGAAGGGAAGATRRIGTDAVCLLASITKPIVATAVLRLVEAGRLDLLEPLPAMLPGLERAGWAPFTAWHVLTHTSGIGDLGLEPFLATGSDRTELLRRTLELPQESVPGTVFRYATAPWDLLAEALAARLGRTIHEIVSTDVLGPLGMPDTTFDPRPALADRRAPVMIGNWDGTRLESDRDLVDAFVGLRITGGGLWGTASDLLRFGRAMLRGGELDGVRVLSRPFVELATREVTVGGLGAAPDPLAASHYALGWGKPGITSPASAAAFGHGGVTGTNLWIDPAADLVLVYLTGVWGFPDPPVDAITHAVYAALP
jgi:CubicO group peptidase (beta-lactamase class C family)